MSTHYLSVCCACLLRGNGPGPTELCGSRDMCLGKKHTYTGCVTPHVTTLREQKAFTPNHSRGKYVSDI
jgi:hypothetical protein